MEEINRIKCLGNLRVKIRIKPQTTKPYLCSNYAGNPIKLSTKFNIFHIPNNNLCLCSLLMKNRLGINMTTKTSYLVRSEQKSRSGVACIRKLYPNSVYPDSATSSTVSYLLHLRNPINPEVDLQ